LGYSVMVALQILILSV